MSQHSLLRREAKLARPSPVVLLRGRRQLHGARASTQGRLRKTQPCFRRIFMPLREGPAADGPAARQCARGCAALLRVLGRIPQFYTLGRCAAAVVLPNNAGFTSIVRRSPGTGHVRNDGPRNGQLRLFGQVSIERTKPFENQILIPFVLFR